MCTCGCVRFKYMHLIMQIQLGLLVSLPFALSLCLGVEYMAVSDYTGSLVSPFLLISLDLWM